jgi:hypothetical protein
MKNKEIARHGHTSRLGVSPTYSSWHSMKARCLNKKVHTYKYYGGRGITVCERWLKFENFLEDMGERPNGFSIDRIDNNGNYEHSNCRWTTQKEQQRNKGKSSQSTSKYIGVSYCDVNKKWISTMSVITRTNKTIRKNLGRLILYNGTDQKLNFNNESD